MRPARRANESDAEYAVRREVYLGNARARAKAWKQANPERAKETARAIAKRDKEAIAARYKAWFWANPVENRQKATAAVARWRERNRERFEAYQAEYKAQNPTYLVDYARKRRKADPAFALVGKLRTLYRLALKNGNGSKAGSVTGLLGCSIAEFKVHLELMFQNGMTWENRGQWHIDHIVPCAAFDHADPAQVAKCWHFTNFQPLWATENLKKNSRHDGVMYRRKRPSNNGVSP